MKQWRKLLVSTLFFALVFSVCSMEVLAAEPVQAEQDQRATEVQPAPAAEVLPVAPAAPEAPVVPEEAPVVPEEAPVVPEEAPVVPEEAPVAPEAPVGSTVEEAPTEVDSAVLTAKPEPSDLPAEGPDATEGEALAREAVLEASVEGELEAPESSDMAEPNAAPGAGWKLNEAGQWSYVGQDGAQHKGWLQEGDSWYYLDPTTGQMKTNWFFDGADWFFLENESGRMKIDWLHETNDWYYLNPQDGRMKTGWLEQNGWYYLNTSGQMQTGLQVIDGVQYDLGETGHLPGEGLGTLANGGRWSLENGIWYYYNQNGSLHKGWLQDGATWYFLDHNNGQMKTNWLFEGTSWYYLTPGTGQMKTNWVHDGSTWYFMDANSGKMQTGWLQQGNWYFLTPGSGQMQTGWQFIYDAWFYLAPGSGEMKTTWVHDGKDWYYMNPTDGRMKTGWLSLDKWYYLTPGSGQMKTGWLDLYGQKYYLKPENGSMQTGWFAIDDYNYYFNIPNGAMEQKVLIPFNQRKITVFDLKTNTYITGSYNDIISRIVAAEVGGFDNMEVYKAQAVAALSWLMYNRQNYPNVTPKVALGAATQTTNAAVAAVSGQYLAYNNTVILAMYGASSAGTTNSAISYFGSTYNLPYLRSVADTHGATMVNHVSHWNTTKMSDAIFKMTGVRPAGDPSTWVQLHGVGGYITGARVAGREISSATFFDNLLGLYSPFVSKFGYANGQFSATTSGNGHGLGMSQTGAAKYAKSGYNYKQILGHYYTGTTIANA